MLEVVNRLDAGPRRLKDVIRENRDPVDGDGFSASHYITAATCKAILASDDSPLSAPKLRGLSEAIRLSRPSETGICLFVGPKKVLAVLPPFPVECDEDLPGFAPEPLLDMLGRDRSVLVILIRLGRYSVGVLSGQRVVNSKSGTRYVKRRHRAGGSSQRRFERSRERLIREFFDHVCEAARRCLEVSAMGKVDFVIVGGEPETVRGFRKRCALSGPRTPTHLSRLLKVARPGHEAMQAIGRQVYSSTVILFQREA